MIYTIMGYYIAAHIFCVGIGLTVGGLVGTGWICHHFMEWSEK